MNSREVHISEGVHSIRIYMFQWSSGPEDVSLLERCPHFRGYTLLGPEHVSTSAHVPWCWSYQ